MALKMMIKYQRVLIISSRRTLNKKSLKIMLSLNQKLPKKTVMSSRTLNNNPPVYPLPPRVPPHVWPAPPALCHSLPNTYSRSHAPKSTRCAATAPCCTALRNALSALGSNSSTSTSISVTNNWHRLKARPVTNCSWPKTAWPSVGFAVWSSKVPKLLRRRERATAGHACSKLSDNCIRLLFWECKITPKGKSGGRRPFKAGHFGNKYNSLIQMDDTE